jgi:hypothetical protein
VRPAQQQRNEAAERRRKRQEAEDAAPRLTDEVPNLTGLRLTQTFRRGESAVQPPYVRLVVVDRAPALFIVPCIEKTCRDGGHDITQIMMSGLRRGLSRFEGSAACEGELGSMGARCGGVLVFEAEATYK